MKLERLKISYPGSPKWLNWVGSVLLNWKFRQELRRIRHEYPQYDDYEAQKMAARIAVREWLKDD